MCRAIAEREATSQAAPRRRAARGRNPWQSHEKAPGSPKPRHGHAKQGARQGGIEPGTTRFRDGRATTRPPAPRRGPGAPTAQLRPQGPSRKTDLPRGKFCDFSPNLVRGPKTHLVKKNPGARKSKAPQACHQRVITKAWVAASGQQMRLLMCNLIGNRQARIGCPKIKPG